MSDATTHLLLPFILAAQAQKHVTHNEALRILDGLVQLSVLDRDLTEPPGSPADGDRYIVASGATGDWALWDLNVALWTDGAWLRLPPRTGWQAWVEDEGLLLVYDGADWVGNAPTSLQNLAVLGVGISGDETNRLAVSADAVLFTHDGAGIQAKLNKASDSETASLLFQTGWSGRAEIGLAGDEDLHLKVSADGTAWAEALRVDAATGKLSGAGIAGLVGTVAQSGGVPTGDVIERGSNANGEFTRLADGTQICWNRFDLVHDLDTRLLFDWTFPIAFGGPTFPIVISDLQNEFGVTPLPEDLVGPFAREGTNPSRTGCSVRIYRRNGAADFQSGDSLAAFGLAIGRWF